VMRLPPGNTAQDRPRRQGRQLDSTKHRHSRFFLTPERVQA
jgi:hypothetical protein